MRVLSLSQLKATLSAQLRHIATTGNHVLILHRGKPIARLSPLRNDETLEESLLYEERKKNPSSP